MAFSPARFLREVKIEIGRVTWPTRKETLATTGIVMVMAVLASIFFFVVDQLIGFGVRFLFGVG